MTIRRKNGGVQAAPSGRRPSKHGRARSTALQLVPRNVVRAAAGAKRSVGRIRPSLPGWIDPHPAIAILIAAAIIFAVCFLYVSQVTNVSNANYELQKLQGEYTQLLRKQDDLRLQIARAQALTTIAERAARNLSMVPLGDQFSYLPLADGPLASLPAAPAPQIPAPTPQP